MRYQRVENGLEKENVEENEPNCKCCLASF